MSPKESVKNNRVAELIKQGITERGVRGLALVTGLSPAIITRYSQGKVGEPTTATLDKLASFFEVPVAELRGERELYGTGSYEDQVVFHLDKGGTNEVIIGVSMDNIIQIGTNVAGSILEGLTAEDLIEKLQPYRRGLEASVIDASTRPKITK